MKRLLDGVYDADMARPAGDEDGGVPPDRKPVHPVRGQVHFEGSPAANAQVTFHRIEGEGRRFARTGDALAEADGTFTLSTYAANDGAPAGEYAVTVVWRKPPANAEGKPGPNLLPERYARPETTPLRATVKAGTNQVTLELKK